MRWAPRTLYSVKSQHLGKEVKTVKYTKPELLIMAAAAVAVQSTSKGGTQHLDNIMQQTYSNPPAYEADE